MWHTTIKILQECIRIYDIPCKVNMMLDDTSVILLMNWEAQEWKLKMYSSRLYDQVLKVDYLGFTVLPVQVQKRWKEPPKTVSIYKWHKLLDVARCNL
jgi:hypothetical protein